MGLIRQSGQLPVGVSEELLLNDSLDESELELELLEEEELLLFELLLLEEEELLASQHKSQDAYWG